MSNVGWLTSGKRLTQLGWSHSCENRYGGGLAFWPYGHNSNIKVFFTRVHRDPGRHDFNVITAQWQVYVY